MDGYIKKSDAVDVIVKYPYNISGKTATAIKMIEGLPDADVVPKSEVDRLVDKWIGSGELNPDEKTLRLIEALRDEARRYERYYFNHEYDKLIAEAKTEVAREIFAEIERVIGNKYNHYVFGNNDLDSIEQDAIINFSDTLSDEFSELKKKYTE